MNTKISFRLIPVMAAFAAMSLQYGCGQKVEVKDEEITTDSASVEAKVKLDEILASIPPPSDMTKELSKAGFTYNRNILNSSGKSSSYSTNAKAAANIGVYSADLGYAISYGQTQDCMGYLNSIKQLSEKVGIGSAFDENLLKKFESSIGKKDSLEEIFNSAYAKAQRNLRSNQRVSTTAIISSGAWVEGLYASLQVIGSAPRTDKNDDLYNRVWKHIYSIRNITELLRQYKNNADCTQMLKDLAALEQVANDIEKTPNLSQKDLAVISEKLYPLRNQIVN